MARSIVPFGPQHPVLPEPIHLDLVLEDETVVEAIPSIGFVHRGLEKLVQKKDFIDYVYVAERICGICSFMHGMGYCQAVESIMHIELPRRADYLRVIWAEMSRIHSHLLWLGLLADAFGFESLFMQSWRLREKILDMFEASTGGRVIFSVNKIGGVRKDMDADMLKAFLNIFNDMEKQIKELTTVFLNDYSVNSRLKGIGVLTKQQAHELGAVGPMMRASGIAMDIRKLGYSAYGDIDFDVITATEGDSYARTKVRIAEIFQAIDIIRQAISKIPDGEISVPVKGNPNGEHFARLEQPRGEVIYYAKGNGTKFLDRMRVRTPTFANIPAMMETMKGCQLADIPTLILTIDPCISCTER
ncbi:MAG TPA: NADH-quinone oxidoreductase subunit D [Ruminococcaceae bacterium]|nr:NADH-quinone oxidoreductase subunit D [Oscillospiraceae bacterium]